MVATGASHRPPAPTAVWSATAGAGLHEAHGEDPQAQAQLASVYSLLDTQLMHKFFPSFNASRLYV